MTTLASGFGSGLTQSISVAFVRIVRMVIRPSDGFWARRLTVRAEEQQRLEPES
jgi:hypothetical protein